MKILIDAFGGDNSPEQIIEGAIDTVNEREGFTAVLVGKEDIINEQLKDKQFELSLVKKSQPLQSVENPTVLFALHLRNLKKIPKRQRSYLLVQPVQF